MITTYAQGFIRLETILGVWVLSLFLRIFKWEQTVSNCWEFGRVWIWLRYSQLIVDSILISTLTHLAPSASCNGTPSASLLSFLSATATWSYFTLIFSLFMLPLAECEDFPPLSFFVGTTRSFSAWRPSPPSFSIHFLPTITSCDEITNPTLTCRCVSSKRIHWLFSLATIRNAPFFFVTPLPCALITVFAIIFCGRSMPASPCASTASPSLLCHVTLFFSVILPPSALFLTTSVPFPWKIYYQL